MPPPENLNGASGILEHLQAREGEAEQHGEAEPDDQPLAVVLEQANDAPR